MKLNSFKRLTLEKSLIKVQEIQTPRIMTVGRRHESRLSLNLFMSFSRRPT